MWVGQERGVLEEIPMVVVVVEMGEVVVVVGVVVMLVRGGQGWERGVCSPVARSTGLLG